MSNNAPAGTRELTVSAVESHAMFTVSVVLPRGDTPPKTGLYLGDDGSEWCVNNVRTSTRGAGVLANPPSPLQEWHLDIVAKSPPPQGLKIEPFFLADGSRNPGVHERRDAHRRAAGDPKKT